MIISEQNLLPESYYYQFLDDSAALIPQLYAYTDAEALFRALTIIPDLLGRGYITAYHPVKDLHMRMYASTNLDACAHSLNLRLYPELIETIELHQCYMNDRYEDLGALCFPIYRNNSLDTLITLDSIDINDKLSSELFAPFVMICSAITWHVLRTSIWQNAMRNKYLTKVSISGDEFKVLLNAYRYAESIGVAKCMILRGDLNAKDLKGIYQCVRHTDYVGVYNKRVYVVAVNASSPDELVIIQRLRDSGFYFDKVSYSDVFGGK